MPRPSNKTIAMTVGALTLWLILAPPDTPRLAPLPSLAITASAETRTAAPRPVSAVKLQLRARALLHEMSADPFSTGAAPRTDTALAAKVVAPPLPFHFVGRLFQGGRTQIFVSRGAKPIAVNAGDRLDGEYLIKSITGSRITFVHLPSATRQIMLLSPPIYDQDGPARRAQVTSATARSSDGQRP